jgi:hypothetical protein
MTNKSSDLSSTARAPLCATVIFANSIGQAAHA